MVTTPAKEVVIDPISADLKKVMRQLKLSPMLDTLPERLALARHQQLSHAAFLELVLADEATRRDTSSAARRARAAGLDPAMRLDTWDEDAAVRYDRTVWTDLTSLRFLDAAHGAVILGAVGVGKTHLATALGHIAVRRRIPTLMLRADAMFKRLRASRLDNSTEAEMRRLAQVRRLIIDDFALQPLDATATADFYELVVARHQRSATTSRQTGGPTKRTCSREPVRKWRRNVTRSHLSGFGEPVGYSAIVEVIGEVDHRSLGSHPERCRYEFRVDRIDQVGQSGRAQRLGWQAARVEQMTHVGLRGRSLVGLGTAGDDHMRVVGAQGVAVIEAALQSGPADRVQRHRVWALAEVDRAITGVDVVDLQRAQLTAGGAVQYGKEPEEGLVWMRRGVGAPAAKHCSLLRDGEGAATKSPVALGRNASCRVDEHQAAIAGEPEELAQHRQTSRSGVRQLGEECLNIGDVHQCPILLAALGIEEAGEVAHGR